MAIDTLKIYDDLLASGVPEVQAHAQAKAIADANKVTPEDLVNMEKELKYDFEASQQRIRADFAMFSQRIEQSLMWMRLIGGGMIVAFMTNGLQGWFK